MKNKPTRHKGDNTFKFLPFAERIASIDVDIFHRVGHKYEDNSEETSTFFHQCIEKWTLLNLTESFDAIRKELPFVETLPQLLNKKEDVIIVLSKNIHVNNTLSLQPTLELVVALARDLRQEFYPFYPELLKLLIDLLNTKNAEQLEWTFTCLAYLFKFLWRCLVKDVDIVFDSLLPLLADNRPSYINNFAAESFAFVARKVKDKKSFLALVLSTLQSRPAGIVGCGRLLFEVMRGVSGQFHSCAEVLLPLYLTCLADKSLPQDILFNVLTNLFQSIHSGIRPQKCGLLWSSTLGTLTQFVSLWKQEETEQNAENICLVLKLLHQCVKYKDSLLLSEPVPVIRQLIELMKIPTLTESVASLTAEIGAALLLSSNAHLPQEHANGILLKVLAIPYPAIVLEFVITVFDYSGFEASVLPHLLSHCDKKSSEGLANDILHVLCKLVLHKALPCKTGMDLANWQQYPLAFPTSSIGTALLKKISATSIQDLMRNEEDVLCSLLLIPHVQAIDIDASLVQLKNVINMLCNELKHTTPADGIEEESLNSDKMLFLLVISLEVVIHVIKQHEVSLQDVCNFDLIMDTLIPFSTGSSNVCALRAMDIFLTSSRLDEMSEDKSLDTLKNLYDHLGRNLSSPYHEVRLLTSHIFSVFEREPKDSLRGSVIHWPLFSLCLAAELVPDTIHEYRDKLKHLQNLDFDSTQLALAQNPHYKTLPLRYLLGVLYINFQLLWEPVSLLIATHAHGMARHEFWEVFGEQLHFVADKVNADKTENSIPANFNSSCYFMTDLQISTFSITDKPDFINYRILLWKSMSHFADVCATRTKDISPLFLSFLEQEYFKSNAGVANSWNVKKGDMEATGNEMDESGAMDESKTAEETEIDAIKEKLLQKPAKTGNKLGSRTGKSLAAHLAIFSKFKDPKSVFKEPELNKIYHDFLSNKNPEIQKLALDCLMTYKHKYMLPYREHLYGLMDDRTFKAELTKFRVDKESELIQANHREELMPIIMRIVHSKMLTKAGSQRGGAAAGQIRRSIVLRFLAGCHEEELMVFVEMAFKIFTKHIKGDVVDMVNSIINNIDLENVIPPKRLQSSMNLLGVILTQFGGLMGKQLLPYLLRILLCVGANVTGMLRQRDSVHPGYLPVLRSVRTLCLESIAQFFDRFERFDWSSRDLDAVFEVMVFPWLDKLTVEGIHSPTALLKLFLVWSQHPRYFALLAKHPLDNVEVTALPHIMQLLQGEKTHISVVNAVLELIERLLTLSDSENQEETDEVEEKLRPLPVTSIVPIDSEAISKLSLSEKINYGSALLLTHISPILERLRMKLLVKNKSLNQRELSILSRVSELVWDSETSDTLLKLLVPMLMKKSSSGEDVVVPLITTLNNLLKNLDDPEKYIRGLAPLFGHVNGAVPRRMLSELMETISSKCSEDVRTSLGASLKLIMDLNAWDKKWIDQPDFNRRLDAFKRVNEMVDSKSINFDLGLIVIHTCFHYLKMEKDLSLKDSAGYCMKRLAPALCLQYADDSVMMDVLINHTVLNLARQGIRDKTDSTYNDAIGLLGAMARDCKDSHPILLDLSHLTNTEDLEVDFFENLQHLQHHRKARALLKFCQVSKNLCKAPNPRTLTQFILPIASTFLMNEKYATKNSMVDAAIETVGTVCRLLPWHQYNLILRFYLDKLRTVLEYQKQLVRIVVAILDAFHFDLSRAEKAGAKSAVAMEIDEVQPSTVSSTLPADVDSESPDEKIELDPKPGADEDILDNELEITLEVTIEPDEPTSSDVLASEKLNVLSPSTALRAAQCISRILLPQLHTCIAQRSHADLKHKVNRRQGGDDHDEEDILRIPIALAAIKLLQQLPKEMLERNLPGIFMKLCSFLKSRLESVRRVTRQTLQKVMIALGPKYISHLIGEMCSLLTRGFQVHVLVYTIHSVMVALKDMFRPGDVDMCLIDVLNCCKMDLFGATSEEKNVSKITGKVQEAKSTKSYDTYQILAQFITEKCFTDLILPVQDVLVHSNSLKMINKAQECLRNIVIGLASNKFVSTESLLIFMYGTISESIPELMGVKKEVMTASKREQLARQRPDTFLIPKAPRSRHGTLTAVAKTTAATNTHILVEFGLKLFHTLLKREKLRTSEYAQYIDPVIPIISECLNAKHIKLTTLSLQCLGPLLKMDLPSMKEKISEIVSSLFGLLHKYAAAGLGKGANFDLVAAAFKAVVVLVRDTKWHTINSEQLKALLLYAEQDMHDHNRQATAFTLLKAILARKLVVPEIHDVMEKVATLSIIAESANVRLQGRQVFHQFLMDYPLGNKLDRHLTFFMAQLDYDLQTGRESALEMFHTVITTFPIEMLSKQSGVLFVALGGRLVNDDVPQCRKMVAQCLQTMVGRLEADHRNKLFDITVLWLKDKKVGHRRLAAQLIGIFVLVEKESFEKRLSSLLPDIVTQFGRSYDNRPGQYVKLAQVAEQEDLTVDEMQDRMSDHHMFQVLQLILKICEHCPRFLKGLNYQEYVHIIAENAQAMLAHAHEWVRLASSQVLGHVFGSLDPIQVAAAVYGKTNDTRFLLNRSARTVKSLVLDLCAQLHPEVGLELADQVVKNLVFLGQVLKNVSAQPDTFNSAAEVADDSEDDQVEQIQVSLLWMVRRMRKTVNTEVVQAPKSTIMRMSVFKWIGVMVLDLSKEALLPLLHHLLAPLVREITSEDESNPAMHRFAIDVSKLMKNKIGMEEYTRHLSILEKRITVRRADRKKIRTREAVTQPENFAKRKIEKQLKKKDAKKRRIDLMKGRKVSKKKTRNGVD